MYTSFSQIFDQQLFNIKSWIRPPNCRSDEFNILRPRADDETCLWILKESEYQNWVAGETQCLWICGPPGCGKSVIASVIAQDLRQRFESDTKSGSGTFIAIAYCLKNEEGKRDALAVIKTLAWHFIDKLQLHPKEKFQVVHHWQKGEPTQDSSAHSARRDLQFALIQLLRDVLVSRPAYLIIDGLDECHNPCGVAQELLEAFKTISEKSKVHVLVASQNLPELSSVLAEKFAKIDLDKDKAKANCGRDIDLIVSRSLRKSEAHNLIKDFELIKARVLQKADGIVLWAILALETITKMMEVSNQNDSGVFLRAIEELPSEGVQVMYKHILGRLEETLVRNNDQDGLRLVTSILCWTTWAVRSLKIEELCIVLEVETRAQGLSTTDHFYANLDEAVARVKRQIKTICYPLLRIQQDDTVAITHSTFKDFISGLDQNSQSLGPMLSKLRSTEAACTMTQCCLLYLLRKPFEDCNKILNDDFDEERFDSEHKFYAYAAFNLKTHGAQAAPGLDVADELAPGFYSLVHQNQGLTWISRLFSDRRYNDHGLQWSLNSGLAKLCKKNWLLVLLTSAIERYKEATLEVGLAQTSMMTYLATLLNSQGSHDEAERMYRDVLALKHSNDIKENDLIFTRSSLGITLSQGSQGRLEEAAELLEEISSKQFTEYGAKDRNTLIARDNLACCYLRQRRYSDAIKLFTETASGKVNHLGREDHSTIDTLNNLVHCQCCCGQWVEARSIWEENLRILKTGSYGEPQLLVCMNNLASVYNALGSLHQAENLQQEVWARRVVIYGELHQDTLMALNNLAFSYFRQSKYHAANDLYQKNLQLATRALGSKHGTTLMIAGDYSDALWALGKSNEAFQLRTKTFEIIESMPPSGRDDVGFSLHAARLADHFQEEWDWGEAERLLVVALKTQCRIYGLEHHMAPTLMTNLAKNCCERNLLQAALELTSKAYAIDRSIFGDRSPDTIYSLLHKGGCLYELGHYADARTSIEEVLNIGKSVLGPDHLTCFVAKGLLAALEADIGDLETARDLYTEERDYIITHYPLDHDTRLFYQTRLAQVHQKLGNLALAKSLQEEAFEKRKELDGDDHLLTASSKCDLAHMLQEMGLFTEALGLAKPALEVR